MSNRMLTTDEQQRLFQPLFEQVAAELVRLSNGDAELLFALRRKLYKELSYLERSKPVVRKKLKARKRVSQDGRCAECDRELPASGAVLDRILAIDGYTDLNTRLICPDCDRRIQAQRGYA